MLKICFLGIFFVVINITAFSCYSKRLINSLSIILLALNQNLTQAFSTNLQLS